MTAEDLFQALMKCVSERIELSEDKRLHPGEDHDPFHEGIAEADEKAVAALQALFPNKETSA